MYTIKLLTTTILSIVMIVSIICGLYTYMYGWKDKVILEKFVIAFSVPFLLALIAAFVSCCFCLLLLILQM